MTDAKTLLIEHTGEGGPVRVRVENVTHGQCVARIAAGILARRMFGRRGVVVALHTDSHAPDYSYTTWQASIGAPAAGGGWFVRGVWLYTPQL